MQILKTVRSVLNKVLGGINVFLFAFMVVIGTYQISVRYLFNKPSTVSEELMTYSFSWMALFAAAYVFGKREHMRMGFLVDKFCICCSSNVIWRGTNYFFNYDTKNSIFRDSNGIYLYDNSDLWDFDHSV